MTLGTGVMIVLEGATIEFRPMRDGAEFDSSSGTTGHE
jgi:hypothetical protein